MTDANSTPTTQADEEKIDPLFFPDPYEGQERALSADQRSVLIRELTKDLSATKTLLDMVAKESEGPLDLSFAHTLMRSKEFCMEGACKALGVTLDTVEEQRVRNLKLRQANLRIHELEQRLGQQGSLEQLTAMLRVLGDKLDAWWDTDGFGYISDFEVSKHGGVKAKFSCSLFGSMMGAVGMSENPVSEKEAHARWLASLRERGLELMDSRRRGEPALLDNDNNRKIILSMIQSRIPSARVTSTENYFENGQATLRSITVFIAELEDVAALPLPQRTVSA